MEREEQKVTAGGVRMSDERTRQEDNTPQVPVSEPATAASEDRFFQNSFFVVMTAIGTVLVLVVFAMWFAAQFTQNVDTDTLSAMLGTGTTVIGTLVGSFVGLRQGQQGRDQAQERAEQSRRETERVLWSALAHVPSDKAEEILRSARSSGVRPS
jgi:heme/copper-type cytochrome/quinol oxidase subunit 2